MTDPHAEAGYYGAFTGGYLVTEELAGCHPLHTDYPLLPGDVLFKRGDGTFGKFGPGLGIEGFRLSDDQQATLQENSDREYTTGDPHGECEHEDTSEARAECDQERAEARAEHLREAREVEAWQEAKHARREENSP